MRENSPELFAGSQYAAGPSSAAHDAIERESRKADHRVRTYAFGASMVYRCIFEVGLQCMDTLLDIGLRLVSADHFDW